MQLWLRI